MPTGTVNLSTGTVIGTVKLNQTFEFILPSPATQAITITGYDQNGNTCAWFSPDPATISVGSTSVTVTAVLDSDSWYTYKLSGMVGATNVHIHVG